MWLEHELVQGKVDGGEPHEGIHIHLAVGIKAVKSILRVVQTACLDNSRSGIHTSIQGSHYLYVGKREMWRFLNITYYKSPFRT